MIPRELTYQQKISALNFMYSKFEGPKRHHDFLCNLLDTWRTINFPFESAYAFKCFTHNREVAFPELSAYVNVNLIWNNTLGPLRNVETRKYAIRKISEKVEVNRCTDICFLADPSFPGGAILNLKPLAL
jgi:hypothetical protein